jgi:threonine aldolase
VAELTEKGQKIIDLRSDTVTQPTPEMREAMARAEVGDDVYGEDPTVSRLEALAAERLGHEAGLFVTSGTQGNQVSVMAHTRRGDEVILEESCHIYNSEVAGLAALSSLMPRPLRGTNGILDPEDVRRAIRPVNVHYARTGLICIESTSNRGGGTYYPLETVAEIGRIGREAGIPVHIDGARIFNAQVASGLPAAEFARHAGSVQFCLSKGLGAPVGSMVVGSRAFIAEARRCRKMLGGGMRQAGIIAAAGIVALEKMVDRLAEDHANARVLAEGLAELDGVEIDLKRVQTNLVFFGLVSRRATTHQLHERLAAAGIRVPRAAPGALIRLVTHKDVDRADILRTLEVMGGILGRRTA